MIERGGENVSCVELENIIATHPKIQDIVVVGIKDSIRDEAIKAFVVLNEGETLSEEEFFRFCEQNMAKFRKCPLIWRSEKICHVIARGK
ncbi:AMP-binding enzyme [Escherichia coli]